MARFDSRLDELKLDNDRAIVPDDYKKELFNDFGYIVRGQFETGEHFHLWTFFYRQIGEEILIDNDSCQTTFIMVDYDEKEKLTMHDSPYTQKGHNIEDYFELGELKVKDTEDSVEWAAGGRTMTSTAPTWHIGGEHAGVATDIYLTQRSQPMFNGQPLQTIKDEGHGAFIIHLDATGTVTHRGKTYKIRKAGGLHERICMAGHVPARMQYMSGRGMNWLSSFGEKMSFYIKTSDVGRTSTMMLHLDGETSFTIGSDKAWIEEVGFWLDPKTQQVNPHKWKVWAVSDRGRLDATLTAYGRGYYTWTRLGGIVIVHQILGEGDVKYTRSDGTIVEERHMFSNEYMRTLYQQPAI